MEEYVARIYNSNSYYCYKLGKYLELFYYSTGKNYIQIKNITLQFTLNTHQYNNWDMDSFDVSLKSKEKPTDAQLKKLQEYFNEMPIEEILTGLHFAKNRWTAKDAGVLKVGRKSIINREVHAVTSEQAQWRLKNWKMMIANYRKRGYSYPTISRIKKILQEISNKKSR